MVDSNDIAQLLKGQPPFTHALIKSMTAGEDIWLDHVREFYLENFVASGGSKVKFLLGGEGTGKTHSLAWMEATAQEFGYEVVRFSLKEVEWKFSHLHLFYQEIARKVNWKRLLVGLASVAASDLGYKTDQYQGEKSIVPLLMEEEGLDRPGAIKEIRKAVTKAFAGSDLSQSFKTFLNSVTQSRMTGETENIHLCFKWVAGEKMFPQERRAVSLYERLTRINARQWFYSLLHLISLSGAKGLVVLIDDMEHMTTRNQETKRYHYTPNAIKDTSELFRQLIDDAEILPHLFIVAAGRPEYVYDDRRGFRSYEALWMRIQTGLVPSTRFNPFSDLISLDNALEAGGDEFCKNVRLRLRDSLNAAGFNSDLEIDPPEFETGSPIRAAILQTAHLTRWEKE